MGISIDLRAFKKEVEKQNFGKLLEIIRILKEVHNVEHVEFGGFCYGTSGEQLKVYYNLLKKVGNICTFSLHFSSFALMVSQSVRKTWKWHKRFDSFLELAAETGAEWVNMHMGEMGENDFIENYVESFLETLVKFQCKWREKGSIPITLENSFQGKLQKGTEYGTKVEHLKSFFELVDNYQHKLHTSGLKLDIGFIIDVAHLNLTDVKLIDLQFLFNRVVAFHCSDNFGKEDKGGIHDPHRIVGEGNIDWQQFVKIIEKHFGDGITIIAENKEIDEAISSIKILKRLFKI